MCCYLNVHFQGQRVKVGKWPLNKIELTTVNLKPFIRYLHSLELGKINRSNKRIEMSTNNRNVRLQQHVVLLTVMERAEDLINKSI